MKIGFTGTREGMTAAQKEGVVRELIALGATELHHGDCVGADADADLIAHELGLYVVIHPPVDETHRAFCRYADETRAPKTHFARNRDIVDETVHLIATPRTMYEEPRGGTWYTVNYARKRIKPLNIVWPDGKIRLETDVLA